MIESIRVAKVATYGESNRELQALSTFNYIYGPNAAGKTTLANLVANPADVRFSNCKINWKNGTPLEAIIYNRDFVARNLSPSIVLKCIFTLGKKNIAILQAIEEAKKKRDDLSEEVVGLNVTLQGVDGNGGKEREVSQLRNVLKEKCWEQKKRGQHWPLQMRGDDTARATTTRPIRSEAMEASASVWA